MDIYEIAGMPSGIDNAGVNFLSPIYAFTNIENGYVYRQVLQSRLGFTPFGNRLSDGSRVMGIFEFILRNGEKELLSISKEFLYKWNSVTDLWDQIPNNSANPFVSFGIVSNSDYVSGTGYPDKNGGDRFVFTGSGMSDIYFYNGTNVKRFTNTTDNPDYQAPAAGVLSKAKYVSYFGERLNLFVPTINALLQPQAVLYSGIRNSAGNGDKFNVAGSGQLPADTYENLMGINIPGDYMLINFNRSAWTLEKTRDAFNPYFFRKIPSVIGTDASFSSVSWNNRTESLGKTGVIVSNGRENVRSDDRIPYFTSDEIDQTNFDLVYGGFDRINAQYLYAYPSIATEGETTQDKVLVHNYEEDTWAVNTQRFSVFGQTDKGLELSWDDIYELNNPSWEMWDTTEQIWDQIGVGAAVQKTLAGDNMGFIYDLNEDTDDYYVVITGITQAADAVVTVNPCALQIGDTVVFENVEGMTEINGLEAIISAVGTTAGAVTSITVNIVTTNFTAYTSGGSVSVPINFSAELAPFNPYRSQGRKVWVSHIEFLINTDGGSLLVDVFENEEESPFIENVLLQPISQRSAREWITMTVNQESNFITLAMSQDSVSEQVQITSIRIHCMPGGLTSS